MTDAIRFAVLGLGLGAMYALAGQGIIVIYRGSGVINFALGAIGTAAAYLAWELQNAGWPFGWAFVAGVCAVMFWPSRASLRRAALPPPSPHRPA